MKTYLHIEDGQIIELVRKDEHDAVVAELEREVAENTDLRQRLHDRAVELNKLRADNAELLARLEERTQAHLHASARDVQTIQRQSVDLAKWQALAEMLAKTGGWSAEPDSSWDAALAAYESAKSGNLPDPLAEAVKRMESVPLIEFARVTQEAESVNGEYEAVRARLIQAAKGEQP